MADSTQKRKPAALIRIGPYAFRPKDIRLIKPKDENGGIVVHLRGGLSFEVPDKAAVTVWKTLEIAKAFQDWQGGSS